MFDRGKSKIVGGKSAEVDVINKPLQKVAKGTSIVFIGSVIYLFFGFIGKLLVIRFWTQGDFGIFSLAFAV